MRTIREDLEINGAKGKWKIKIYDYGTIPDPAVNPREASHPGWKRRDSIQICFEPTVNPKGCKKIAFVQAMRFVAIDANGKSLRKKYYKERDSYQNPANYDRTFGQKSDDYVDIIPHWEWGGAANRATAEHVVIDHVRCEGDPFYNGDDRPQDGGQQGETQTPTEACMSDRPFIDLRLRQPDIKQAIYKFEVCAICYETGECLGSIKWSYSTQDKDKGTIWLDPPKTEHNCAKNSRVGPALKKFMENHTVMVGGKRHWICNDTAPSTPKGEVPEDLYKRYTANLLKLTPGPEHGGSSGGGAMAPLPEVLKHAAYFPESTLIKIDWNSEQVKTKTSISLACDMNISPEHLLPFLPESNAINDFGNSVGTIVSGAFMKRAIAGLFELAPLAKRKRNTVGILVVTDIYAESARAAEILVDEVFLSAWIGTVEHGTRDGETLKTLLYLKNNMGTAFGSVSSLLKFPPLPVTAPDQFEAEYVDRATNGMPS